MRLTLLLSLVPGFLAAQATDTAKIAHPIPVTDSVLRLPVDHASDLLSWLPGGGLDPDGAAQWHGTSASVMDRSTDGIRWATATRSTGWLTFGPSPVVLEPGLNALERAELDPRGRGTATLLFTTLGGGDRWQATGSAEDEGLARADGGTGTSRFEGAVGGPLAGTFHFRASATLLGRRSAPAGIDYSSSPFYVPTGIDTTMRFPDPSSLPDSIDALVQRFGPTSNVPNSPRSSADWAVRVDGRLGGATVWAHWLGTRVAERSFNYLDVANPLQARGEDLAGSDLAAGVRMPLTDRTHLEVALSFQHDRSATGPITSAAEFDSRDPGLGLMLGGLDLRWDLDNFPVDDQLITNYRDNTPGSRRSPYDLENTAQYALIDEYRNNAYGVLGFSESGGPVGLLALAQDSRQLLDVTFVRDLGANGALRLGVEGVRHDAQHYQHFLTSQALSDVWAEKPTELALLLDWTRGGPGWSVDAGARLDHFKTGASRPYLLDTLSFSPFVGQYLYFPRISSYGKGSSVLQHFVPDQGHAAFAPYLYASGRLGGGFTGRGSVSRTARMPDLSYLLAGVNTDVVITNGASPFGTDMGHELLDRLEVGVTKWIGPVRVDASVFNDRYTKVVMTHLGSAIDPFSGSAQPLLQHQLGEGGTYRGVTIGGDWRASAWFRASGSYTYADTTNFPNTPFDAVYLGDMVRPHTLALQAHLQGPASGTLDGFGAVISYRRMTGAARVPGSAFGPIDSTRATGLPDWSSLDLRLAKGFSLAGKKMSVYLDARNLLNAANLLRAFAGGDPTSDAALEGQAWSNDSSAYAVEAQRNSAYSSGNIDLTFGGAGRGGCGAWLTASSQSAPPNCAYLIAAEQRFGDGNGIFTLAEQHNASRALYLTQFGRSAFTAPGRSLRIGAQVSF